MQYRESLGTAIYEQLKNDSSLTNELGSYTSNSTTYAAIFSGQVPENKKEHPYLVIYAPLTPGPATYAYNASGTNDVAREPSFQINIFVKDRLQVSKVQELMDLVDDALSTDFTRKGLTLRPKDPSNGVPEWREDEGHWWVWMRFRAVVLESET